MKSMFIVFFLFAGNAQADLLLGVFEGKTASGEACKIQVNSKYYFPDQKHPLNERVSVTVDGFTWDLSHPPVLNVETGTILFDHNVFQLIQPLDEQGRMGSEALVMQIDHDLDPHPATSYTYVLHDYRDASKSKKVTCLDLKKTAGDQ
jgi:hypothetical protein